MTAVTSDGLPASTGSSNPVFATLQRVGRSLMLPIAVLPAAALLLRFGQDDMLGKDGLGAHAHWLLNVAKVLAVSGNVLFANLPLLFAVGVAVGFARKSDGSTALAAVVGYMVFNVVLTVLNPNTDPKSISSLDLGSGIVGTANPKVLGGILIGIVTALL